MMGRDSVIPFGLILAFILAGGVLVQCSFVTKVNNGFERLVVSIDDQLALPPSTSSFSSSSAFTPSSPGGTGSIKGATHECQAVLEQLKLQLLIYCLKGTQRNCSWLYSEEALSC
ncbi:unnamed protein product [Allacma fusca]|uniref:Uncharacterized protein n=1 Tax=Allacma fusca TaxID=39272 RepID=A0A8J2J590_9HEXA|nr:unnamed protein product [Allacma fusca]